MSRRHDAGRRKGRKDRRRIPPIIVRDSVPIPQFATFAIRGGWSFTIQAASAQIAGIDGVPMSPCDVIIVVGDSH